MLNAGSSSLKFGVYGIDGGLRQLSGRRGGGHRRQRQGRLRITTADGKPVHEAALDAPDHATALDALAAVPDGPLARGGLVGVRPSRGAWRART